MGKLLDEDNIKWAAEVILKAILIFLVIVLLVGLLLLL